MTTNADGTFGPIVVDAGPTPTLLERKILVVLAQGAGIAPTASDITVQNRRSIDHTLAAPSLALADAWRAELSDGGMDRARTRGLVAYRYDETAGTPAAGVTAQQAEFLNDDRPLDRGDEVRYVSADGETVEPTSRSTTTESGLALIGARPDDRGTIEIGGARGSDGWGSVGTLIGEGWVFVETSRAVAR